MVVARDSAGDAACWGNGGAEAKALGTQVENVLGQELWGSQCRRPESNSQAGADRKSLLPSDTPKAIHTSLYVQLCGFQRPRVGLHISKGGKL